MKWVYQCFGISKQAFYKRLSVFKRRNLEEQIILDLIQEVRKELPKTGGLKLYKTIKPALIQNNIKIGRDRFYELLRRHRLLIPKSKRAYITTDSKHHFYKYPNLIKDFIPTAAEQLWVSDITYIKTDEGNAYLALVTDAYSKKIMGYKLDDHMKTSLCIDALRMAISLRKYPNQQLIHHSDRGLQYCNPSYTNFAESKGIFISMTQQYDPYENAVAERINGILKQEFGLGKTIVNLKLAQKMIKKAVSIYNSKRMHYSLNFKTPDYAHKSQNHNYKP
ncbi:IS3 family transposase [Psychroflexus salinarum]|uniref:IS3 family transposase n=1 Tax=Psychroflexus salinarum TaxID=546024 RepID=A0ABW3GLY4_9FLAO